MARRTIAGSRGIVTGASSGIGRAVATELARQGAKLVLVARREEKLRELADSLRAGGAAVELVVGDVTEAAVRQQAVERSVASFGGLDFLVNNAGVGAIGRFEDAAPRRLEQIMQVNFFATAEMIRAALPALRQGRRPIVVNISSILGHRGIPHASEYCASKFAVQGLSESLRAEFARLGIDVLVVSPGSTNTEFFESALDPGQYPWPKQPGVEPQVVAQRTVRAMRQGRHQIMINARGKLLVWLNRLAPRLVDSLLGRYG